MSLFRSAPMKYYQLFIPTDQAYSVVSKLAPHSFVEFMDSNQDSLHKPYYNSIKRCHDSIAKIDSLMALIRKHQIHLPPTPSVPDILKKQEQALESKKTTSLSMIEHIESAVDRSHGVTQTLTRSIEQTQKEIISLQDYKYLLFKARQVFFMNRQKDLDMDSSQFDTTALNGISGVIAQRDTHKFAKIIFRATKSNSILYTFPIPNNYQKHQPRTAFMLFIQSGNNIYNKINRICDSFNAKRYTIPSVKNQIFQKIKYIENTINDSKQLLIMTEKKLVDDLESAVEVSEFGFSKLQAYRIILEKQTLIYNTMNKFLAVRGSYQAQIWIPTQKQGLLQNILPSVVSYSSPQTRIKPPTYFQTNTFTAPFQEIINTYGIPRYQEVNPALFAIPIFPFLFGVMFGDIGHGGVLLCAALWMLYSKDARALGDIYGIRYLLLLMGIFAFYSGWIYNQFFSIPLNVFGSCYPSGQPQQQVQRISDDCVYPIGFDPRWIRTTNQLNFFNSYKMKFAVIIGVLQMTFGIVCKLLNTIHFKNWLQTIFEWLPQQVFFFCTFGYMCVLIIYKWTIPWQVQRDTSQAPSIIAQMIALPLKAGSTQGKPLWDMQAQENLQLNLLTIALICVPWMLLIKPFIIWMRMPKHEAHDQHSHDLSEQLIEQNKLPVPSKKHQAHDQHQDIGEIAVHQIIETIQFVLGSISNTASYLRLWALSLAHGQLSKVFLEKTIGGGMQSANAIVIVFGMYFFFNITIGVIMCMDVMECFLHALRLQWVEFDSKFFKADGRKFEPLCLEGPIQASVNKVRNAQ